MNEHEFDDIDRLLFSLPLEEPPQGLRASILSVTVAAPKLRPAMFAPWEIGFVAVCAAFAVWLTIGWLFFPPFAHQLLDTFEAFGRTVATPSILAWLAVGASLTFWLSIAPPRLFMVPLRRVRS